jgi:hypothetical protein
LFQPFAAGLSLEMMDFFDASSKSPAVSKAMAGKPCEMAIKLGNVWMGALKAPSGFFDAEAASTLLWQRSIDTANAAGARTPFDLGDSTPATSASAPAPMRPSS